MHSSVTQVLYAFGQTPSLRVRERGLGTRLDSTLFVDLKGRTINSNFLHTSGLIQLTTVVVSIHFTGLISAHVCGIPPLFRIYTLVMHHSYAPLPSHLPIYKYL